MYSEELEELIEVALADGVLTEKKKQVLFKKAKAQGVDLDEFEMVLNARLLKAQQPNRPTKVKRGNVVTCPNCGAYVQAYSGKCPECGYEFENVEANLSSKKMAELLQQAKTDSQKNEIIETFPLPNTKADLLEFLTALKPRILDVNSTFANSYYKKYQECIEKARISFGDDEIIKGYIDEFEKINSSISRAKNKHAIFNFIKNHNIITSIATIVLLITAIIVYFSVRVNYRGDEDDCKMMVRKSIKAGHLDKAEQYLYSFKYGKFYLDDAYAELIEANLQNNDIGNAKQIADHYTEEIGRDIVYKPIYEYLMKHEMYEEAEKYIPNEFGIDAEKYFNHLKLAIENMCKDGKYDQAKKYLKIKCVYFEVKGSRDYKYCRKDVLYDLNALISSYEY